MKQDEIIEMAVSNGFYKDDEGTITSPFIEDVDISELLLGFAEDVAAKEREACAKLCDLAMLQNQEAINELEEDEHIAQCFIQGAMTQLVKTSKAIRARAQADGGEA